MLARRQPYQFEPAVVIGHDARVVGLQPDRDAADRSAVASIDHDAANRPSRRLRDA